MLNFIYQKSNTPFIKSCFLAISLGFCGSSIGQTATTPEDILPPGPWPARAPNMSSWTVSIKDNTIATSSATAPDSGGESGVAPPAFKKQIAVTKTWPIIHEITVNSLRQITDMWYVKGKTFTSLPGSERMAFFDYGSNGYGKNDFSGLDWLSKENYQGVETYGGQKYFYFKGRLSELERSGSTITNDTKNSEAKVYLDVKTLLPVTFINGDEVWIYKFGPPPTVMQTLPEKIAALLAKLEQGNKSSAAHPF